MLFSFKLKINRRDNNIVNSFSYIRKIASENCYEGKIVQFIILENYFRNVENIRKNVHDTIISPIFHIIFL